MASLDADVLVEERVVVVPVQATFLFSEISNKSFEVGQREFALAPGSSALKTGRFGTGGRSGLVWNHTFGHTIRSMLERQADPGLIVGVRGNP